MKTFESYMLLITPLSPVHIGTGDSYDPTNYVIEDDALYEFDPGEMVDLLSGSDRDSLLNALEQRPNEETIKFVQRFFYQRRADLIPLSRNHIRVFEGVASFYRDRVGKAVQREGRGAQVINRLEIDRTASNPLTNQPVLLGSSVKGAIRTALLDSVNAKRRLQFDKEKSGELQQRLFRFAGGKFEQDPLRLIQIGDATWQSESGLPAAEVYIAVNRKKMPVKDERGALRVSQAEEKGLCQILECLPALRYRALSGQLNIQSVGDLTSAKVPSLRFDLRSIARACNDFYGAILVEENRLLADRGFVKQEWRSNIEGLLTRAIGNQIERGETLLLRVGRHSGAESVTLRGVRNIKIMRGKDRDLEYAPSPKTLWLAAEELSQQKDMLPFGWLLVEVVALEKNPVENPALRNVCEASSGAARTWAARQQQVMAERMRQYAEQESRRRQEAEQARLREQERSRIAKAEAEKQARLASMSKEERAIEKVREIYERDKRAGKKDSGGELASTRAALLSDAKTWPSDLRRKAADLISETVQWVGWPKQKAEERRKQLEELRKP